MSVNCNVQPLGKQQRKPKQCQETAWEFQRSASAAPEHFIAGVVPIREHAQPPFPLYSVTPKFYMLRPGESRRALGFGIFHLTSLQLSKSQSSNDGARYDVISVSANTVLLPLLSLQLYGLAESGHCSAVMFPPASGGCLMVGVST